jgi:uncharacterized protein YggE
MSSSRNPRLVALVLAAVLALVVGVPGTSAAQDVPSGERAPHLIVSATEEIEVPADRAHLTVTVESRGRTSQLAASENARVQSAVLSAIRRAGIASAQLRTQAVTVTPEYQYPKEGGRPTVVGYQGRNVVAVEIRDLARIGQVIDAALGAGATSIAGPRFALSAPDSARREALDAAVRKARADAVVMARAAGVQLGRTLELTSTDNGEVPMQDLARMVFSRAEAAPAAETPIEVGLIKIRAGVTLRIAISQAP